MPRRRRLTILFAALLAVLAAAPGAHATGAEDRVGAFLSTAGTHTGPDGPRTPSSHQGTSTPGAGIAASCCVAAKAAPSPPNRIYSARELRRRAAEPGPFHNFPESFNDEIFERGTRTVTPGFFKKPRANLSNDSVQYRLAGEINGRSGTYEIFARPSASGRTEVITHRFFRPGPR